MVIRDLEESERGARERASTAEAELRKLSSQMFETESQIHAAQSHLDTMVEKY